MTGFNIHNLAPFTVGFDRIFDRLVEIERHPGQLQSGFPPYNIRTSKDELKFSIELALAGLTEDDVDIEVKENQLTIKSVYDTKDDTTDTFVHKGISKRKFTRSFTLADDIEVIGASFKNGLLTIGLERIIPEEKRPQKIKIDNKKEFLVE